MTRPGEREEIGSLAEEAARLVEALQDRLRRRGSDGDNGPATGATGHSAGAAESCALCPLCQGLTMLRETRPEVLDHLGDAAASLLAAARELLPAPDPAPSRRRSTAIQHIDIDIG